MGDQGEPEDWGTFFSETKAKLVKLIKDKHDARTTRDETPREKIVALQQKVNRAQRIQVFLSSDIWKDDLEPFFRAEAALPPWKEGNPLAPEEALTQYVYNSGKTALASKVVSQLRAWVQIGVEAELALKREQEKNKLARAGTP